MVYIFFVLEEVDECGDWVVGKEVGEEEVDGLDIDIVKYIDYVLFEYVVWEDVEV